MSAMSIEEQLATDLALSVEKARHNAINFGYLPNQADAIQSHANGMFIVWLTAMEEGRHFNAGKKNSYQSAVIDQLPSQDKPEWLTYIGSGPVATLRNRAEALWGIRIAVTHADGDTSKITNAKNRQFALDAPNAIPGVNLNGTMLDLSRCNLHTPIRTMQQIRDLLHAV